MKRRVVVTGIGALTPIGNNPQELWESVKAGKCGIDFIKNFDTSNHKVKIAAEIKNFNMDDYIEKRDAKKMDTYCQYAVVSAKQAFADSGLDIEKINPERFGVIYSSGVGGIGTMEREHTRALEKSHDRVSPFFVPMLIVNMGAGCIAIELGAKGICTSVVTACASATSAIGDAFRHIRDGYAEIMCTGGSEASVTELGIGGFTSMKALTECNNPKRASIPFDKERSGFVSKRRSIRVFSFHRPQPTPASHVHRFLQPQ